jgi:hypothetical protein
MADYSSSGIWVTEPVGLFRHGMIGHARLGLPSDLAARFNAWIELYWKNLDGSLDLDAFNAEGLELAQELKQHVGRDTEVVFAPESEVAGLRPEQIIDA